MNDIFITVFILLANLVSIFLTYKSFDKNMEKNKRLLYTMISFGVMYILVLIVYFFSSIGIDKTASDTARSMITFTFVPVNAIIILPFLIRSFFRKRNNEISIEQLNTRAVIVLIIAVLILFGEFFYFKKIQNGIVDLYNQKKNAGNVAANITNIE